MKVSREVIRHPVIAFMVLIILIVFGFYSLAGQNIEFMSDINLPSVIVLTVYPGAGASDVEQDVTSILEDEFVTLPHYKSMDSVSSDSMSVVTIYYQDDVDPYDQLEEVRYRIRSLQSDLPDDIQGEPLAMVGGASMLPIISFSVRGGADLGKVTDYVEDELVPRINRIAGVADVTVDGGRNLEVLVTLRLADLAACNLSVTQVYQMIEYANTALPVGTGVYRGKSLDIRYEGDVSSLDELEDTAVGYGEDGSVIHLSDVADVTLSYAKEDYLVESDGTPLVVVNVTKRSDGNIVRINNRIRTILADEEQKNGQGLTFSVIGDDSRTTMASLWTVVTSGLGGVVMAILVILLFLGDGRATLIIGLSIPLSLLFAFIGMKILGITVNLMSLSGLVAALGMVVDGSIVMLEQVYRHYRKRTMSVGQCIDLGSDEVGSSILASNLTTIVVFIPISMLTGLVGMILKDVALTIILALVGSFLVAVVFVPLFLKFLLRPEAPKRKVRRFEQGMAHVEKGYGVLLSWSLDHGIYIIVVAICILVISLSVVSKLGMAFIPSTDNSDLYVHLSFPDGYTKSRTRDKSRMAERIIRSDVPEIKDMVFYDGKDDLFGMSAKDSESFARVVLVPVADRTRDIHDIILLLQRDLSAQIPDATVRVENGGFDKLLGYASGGGGYAITLVSEDEEMLYGEAKRLEDHLEKDPAVMTVSLDTSFDTSRLSIDMARSAMNALGINGYEAGLTARILFKGIDDGRFTATDGTRYTIKVQSDVTDSVIDENTLNAIEIHSMAGTPINLGTIADMDVRQSLGEINHTDRANTITVSATLVSEDTTPVNRRMQAYLASHPLADGVESETGGILELISDSVGPMVTALLIAWFMVYSVMVIQFERFRQPAIIILSIPFCIIGVVLGLLLFGSTLSLISLLGIIALGGIVVNNAIILIDYVNLLRQQRKGQQEEKSLLRTAVLEGCASRIRPIFMTTLTTMLGVVPMAVASGEGAEIYAPLGQAIAGGLLTSTLITLFVIPVLYYLTERHHLDKKGRKQS